MSSREVTTIPTQRTAHRVTHHDTSTNIITSISIYSYRCNCGYKTLYNEQESEAFEDMQTHLQLANEGKIPSNLLCTPCHGSGRHGEGRCLYCEGTGIRRDIPSQNTETVCPTE